MSRAPYSRLEVEEVIRVKNYDRALWALVLLGLVLSTMAFIFVINKRLADGGARETVKIERDALRLALINLQESLRLEYSVVFQKNYSHQLEEDFQELKYWVGNNTLNISAIDNLTALATEVNQTIVNLQSGYESQIVNLEQSLDTILSTAQTNATTLQNGQCSLQGLTALPISYEYKKLVVAGLDYYYYTFSPTAGEINIDSTGFNIQSCLPTIYQGPTANIQSPLFTRQLEKFTGTAKEFITSLEAGNEKLHFHVGTFSGTKSIGVSTSLSHFVSFF